MKLRLLALLTILLLALTACKSTEEPKPDPLKLSERAGTYENTEHGGTVALVVKADGTADFTPPGKIEQNIILGIPSSTEITFNFEIPIGRGTENWSINFQTLVLSTTATTYPNNVRSLIMIKK